MKEQPLPDPAGWDVCAICRQLKLLYAASIKVQGKLSEVYPEGKPDYYCADCLQEYGIA